MHASIGASLIAHNAVKFDYCVRETVLSVAPFCAEIVCVDAQSTDSTPALLDQLKKEVPQLKIIHAEWKPVVGTNGVWLSELSNIARLALSTDYHFAIQADEVVGEWCYEEIVKRSAQGEYFKCWRHNFWADPWHLIPQGQCCGWLIPRGAPRSIPYVGDAEGLDWGHNWVESKVEIFHYGFIRKLQAYVDKMRSFQIEWLGRYDPRMDVLEKQGTVKLDKLFFDHLPIYQGKHPVVAHNWLRERGWDVA